MFPLFKKEGFVEGARDVVQTFLSAGINAKYDESQSIGKRYSKHDEIGTPYCLTINHQSIEDGSVTIRDRDTTAQERITVDEAIKRVQTALV